MQREDDSAAAIAQRERPAQSGHMGSHVDAAFDQGVDLHCSTRSLALINAID